MSSTDGIDDAANGSSTDSGVELHRFDMIVVPAWAIDGTDQDDTKPPPPKRQ